MTTNQSNISNIINIKQLQHKAEVPLKIFSLIFSICIYCILTHLSTNALRNPKSAKQLINYIDVEENFFKPLIRFGAFFVLLALIVLYIIIVWKFFKNFGEAVSCDLPVSNKQLKNLKDNCTLYAKRLGLKSVPELYISQEGTAEIETSFMTIKNEQYIRLNCYYTLTACDTGNYNTINFLIASELAHIALRHRDIIWTLLTLPARVCPFFNNIVARTMNYSADAIAAELIGNKEAIDAIIILSNDPYMACLIDKNVYISDIINREERIHHFARIYYNFLSEMSVPAYRIEALLNSKKKDGKLI